MYIMTLERAIDIFEAYPMQIDGTHEEALEVLLNAVKYYRAKLNDRLPNGGMVSHEAKHSMQPTLKHDTE